MYLPAQFEVTDKTALHGVIEKYPLGTWIVSSGLDSNSDLNADLTINHIPFLLDEACAEHGTLVGHVARANPIWRLLKTRHTSAVVFQGEQGYVSPSWYASKQEHHRAVPTWNYAVVHAHGMARAIEDRDWLLRLVTRLSNKHEADQPTPWQISQAPAEYIEKMLETIVGIEMPIDKLVGKFKLSQNRSRADQQGVISGLQQVGNADSLAMAELIKHQLDE